MSHPSVILHLWCHACLYELTVHGTQLVLIAIAAAWCFFLTGWGHYFFQWPGGPGWFSDPLFYIAPFGRSLRDLFPGLFLYYQLMHSLHH